MGSINLDRASCGNVWHFYNWDIIHVGLVDDCVAQLDVDCVVAITSVVSTGSIVQCISITAMIGDFLAMLVVEDASGAGMVQEVDFAHTVVVFLATV